MANETLGSLKNLPTNMKHTRHDVFGGLKIDAMAATQYISGQKDRSLSVRF